LYCSMAGSGREDVDEIGAHGGGWRVVGSVARAGLMATLDISGPVTGDG
jgi:hypothetical protein